MFVKTQGFAFSGLFFYISKPFFDVTRQIFTSVIKHSDLGMLINKYSDLGLCFLCQIDSVTLWVYVLRIKLVYSKGPIPIQVN